MINTKFEAYKIAREIKKLGNTPAVVSLEFRRPKFVRDGIKYSFGELQSSDSVYIGNVSGILHEESTTAVSSASDSGEVRTVKTVKLLTTKQNAQLGKLRYGDFALLYVDPYHTKRFVLIAMDNIQNWGIVYDFTLEVVDAIPVGSSATI